MLVVPTCRLESLEAFFKAWGNRGGWDAVCVVEDSPTLSAAGAEANTQPDSVCHYSHAEINATLGDDAWIISRRDSAIRCFGFLLAHRAGMDVLTLDDDVFPVGSCGSSFVALHRNAMQHNRWAGSVPGMRTRGMPYRNLGNLESAINVGLWTGVPDLDGPQGLLTPMTGFVPPPGTRLIPAGQHVPVCGMNLYIKHEAIPLCYFPPMGEGQPYKRLDDIWGGILAKRALDALGWHMSVGEPFVEHRRASDPFANLVKEAPGIVANETFWETIDGIKLTPRKFPTAAKIVAEIGDQLERHQDNYIKQLGRALQVWARLCGGK